MELDQHQIHAAHQLGEAILRFVKTIESGLSNSDFTAQSVKSTERPPHKAAGEIENRLLRASEVAEMLSLGRSKIYELTYSGRLPSVKIGSARRFKLSEVLKLLDGIE